MYKVLMDKCWSSQGRHMKDDIVSLCDGDVEAMKKNKMITKASPKEIKAFEAGDPLPDESED